MCYSQLIGSQSSLSLSPSPFLSFLSLFGTLSYFIILILAFSVLILFLKVMFLPFHFVSRRKLLNFMYLHFFFFYDVNIFLLKKKKKMMSIYSSVFYFKFYNELCRKKFLVLPLTRTSSHQVSSRKEHQRIDVQALLICCNGLSSPLWSQVPIQHRLPPPIDNEESLPQFLSNVRPSIKTIKKVTLSR